MPKTAAVKSRLFVFKHAQERVLVYRPTSYKLAIDAACKEFQALSKERVILQTNELDICAGQYVNVTDETWNEVVDSVNSLLVVELPQNDMAPPQDITLVRSSTSTTTTRIVKQEDDKIRVILKHEGWEIEFRASKSTLVQKLVDIAARKLGKEDGDFRGLVDGCIIGSEETIGSCGIEDGDQVDLRRSQLGGKPVIYMYSPIDVHASVKLFLIPEWRFSTVYPAAHTTINHHHGECIEWNVQTHQDGSLTETNTRRDVSYLFWEAETNPGALPSPPQSPVFGESQAVERFSPVSSDLCDTDSVVLSMDKITPYLDTALQALGLHTEARTSFITYWLPSILKHGHIALRFLPQISYERAAPLDISPRPDIITRIFMLFKGVPEDRLVDWSGAQRRAVEDVDFWRNVVGVDVAKAGDAKLFRVLEWGGMEVLRG